MSVGYVVWLFRGGLLLGSLLSSLPAWHVIDPLPVLARSVPVPTRTLQQTSIYLRSF
jgi:hypothetical protein